MAWSNCHVMLPTSQSEFALPSTGSWAERNFFQHEIRKKRDILSEKRDGAKKLEFTPKILTPMCF